MDTEECFLDLEDEDDGDGDRESLSDRKLRKLCFLHKCLGVLNRAANDPSVFIITEKAPTRASEILMGEGNKQPPLC